MEQVEVVEVPERQRFELRVDGELRGLVDYRRQGDRHDLHHTEVDPELGGRGMGTRLVHGALDALAGRGATVVPTCPFVAHVIDREPRYAALVES